MHDLLPILEQTMRRKFVLPQRKISDPEEFLRLFPETAEVFVDGVERLRQRPKKKKSGRRHDKRLADKESVFENIPREIPVYTDTAFIGESKVHKNIILPKKKSKGKPLT